MHVLTVRALATLAALLLSGCNAGVSQGAAAKQQTAGLPLPSAALDWPTTRLTLRLGPDVAPARNPQGTVAGSQAGEHEGGSAIGSAYRTATIARVGSSVRITIAGLDFGAITRVATGSLDSATLVVENAPAGKNRVITVQALDGGGNPIAGAIVGTAADLVAGSQTLELSARSTALGNVFARLLQTQAGRQVVGSIRPDAVKALLDQIRAIPPRAMHYALIDAIAVADAIAASGGTLPAPSASFQVAPGKVRLTVRGAPENVRFQAWVGDPASPRGTGLSHLGSQTGDVYEIGPVLPGTWPVTVSVPRLGTRTGTVTVGPGETSSLVVDFSTWQAGPPLPVAVGAMGAVAIGSRIYAIGGVLPGGRAADTLFMLDTAAASPEWVSLARLPTPREGPGVGVLDGKIVVAGGQATTDVGTARLTTVEIYDPQTDTWTTGSRLPGAFVGGSSRSISWGGLPAASTGTRLLAFQAIADFGVTLSAGAEYDAVSDTWNSQTVPLPLTPRLMAAAAFLGTRFYLAGGLRPANPVFNPGSATQFPLAARPEFEFLDLAQSPPAWRAGPPMPTGRAELALAASRTRLYAVGGVGPGDKACHLVEVFDPATGAWSYAGSMRVARSSFGLVASGGKLWAIGGAPSRALGYFGGGSALATDSVEFMPLPEGSP